MTLIEKNELERTEAHLRQIARELKAIAPSISLRVNALATEVSLRRQLLEMRS